MKRTLFCTIIFLLAACTALFSDYFQPLGEQVEVDIFSADFKHRIASKKGTGNRLHVYIEGDGQPWASRNRIARDPTPRQTLMPALMAADPAPGLFLGRPCYFRTQDELCSPHWWTFGRYHQRVVQSMNQALDALKRDARDLVLIGHSGGGTLAMLMASRRRDVSAVITLAGNLDTLAWAQHHDYTPLQDSLNPSEDTETVTARQFHYLGKDDEIITNEMFSTILARYPSAGFQQVDGMRHKCCWETVWPAILQDTESALSKR